ncbi:MAG: B12-binding domain-containing radical SAM protein [Planctomycetota bacterium]
MKVLLVQANVLSERSPLNHPRVYPLGLSYVGTALKLKGHQVQIFDPSTGQEPLVTFREKIMEMEPQIVGFSLRHVSFYPKVVIERVNELAKEIRKARFADTKILIGGPSFSLYPEKLMKCLPEVDYGFLYEGEESVPDFLENLENPEMTKGVFLRKAEKVIFTGGKERIDFGIFPMPRRDLLDMSMYLNSPYSIGVQTKRGCALKCTYCAYPHLDGTTLRLRKPESVVDEIEHLVSLYGVKSITFADNVFNIPMHHAEEICRGLIKRGVDIQWTAWFHDKYVTREFMELAREAGCNKVEFSPDGFSDHSLRCLGKGMTQSDIISTYNIIKDMKELKVRYHFFFWAPGQSFVTFLKLIWFRLKAKSQLGRRFMGFGFGPICIEPNTALEEAAVEQGIIKEETDLLFSTVEYWPARWIRMLFKMKKAFRLVGDRILAVIRKCRRERQI